MSRDFSTADGASSTGAALSAPGRGPSGAMNSSSLPPSAPSSSPDGPSRGASGVVPGMAWESPLGLRLALAGLGAWSALGNLLLAAALGQQLRRGRLPPGHAWLLNLAAADLLLALGCLPARLAAPAASPARAWLCPGAEWLLHTALAAKSFSWAAVGRARAAAASPSASSASSSRPSGRGWRLLGAGRAASTWAAGLLLALPRLLFTREGATGTGRPLGLPAAASPSSSCCTFQPPEGGFVELFGSLLYPLAACLAPAGLALWGYWLALRPRRRPLRPGRLAARTPREPSRLRRGTGTLLGLTLLFHATWLPAWVGWLWERPPGDPRRRPPPLPPPPRALAAAAEVLLFLDGALGPALLLALSAQLRRGLRGSCGAGGGGEAGEGPGAANPEGTPLPDRKGGEPAEKRLPDLEHFWKERKSSAAGEESDPTPWEHQGHP